MIWLGAEWFVSFQRVKNEMELDECVNPKPAITLLDQWDNVYQCEFQRRNDSLVYSLSELLPGVPGLIPSLGNDAFCNTFVGVGRDITHRVPSPWETLS